MAVGTTPPTPLIRVIDLNEGVKAILGYAHEVNLRALDAIVRSARGGRSLAGFNEVASQMRQWCRELQVVVDRLKALALDQVQLVSALTKRERMAGFLTRATHSSGERFIAITHPCIAALDSEHEQLRRTRRRVRASLEELEQLGLMATVLSRAALIESAHGGDHSRSLSIVSAEFAARSDEVNAAIRLILRRDREAIS